MNRYLLYLYIILLSNTLTVQAQELTTSVGQELMDVQSAQRYFQTEVEFDHTFKGVQGSPYYKNDWEPALIKLENGQVLEGEILYDLVEGRVIIKRRGNIGAVMKKDAVSEFQFNNLERFVYLPSSQDYYQVLIDGKVKLIALNSKRLRMASSEKVYGTNQDYHQFLSDTKYFILDAATGEITKAPSGMSGFVKLFPQYKGEIRRYAREQQLILRKPDHLSQMVKHLNSLQTG